MVGQQTWQLQFSWLFPNNFNDDVDTSSRNKGLKLSFYKSLTEPVSFISFFLVYESCFGGLGCFES